MGWPTFPGGPAAHLRSQRAGGLVCLDVSRYRGVDAFPGGPAAHLRSQRAGGDVGAHGGAAGGACQLRRQGPHVHRPAEGQPAVRRAPLRERERECE